MKYLVNSCFKTQLGSLSTGRNKMILELVQTRYNRCLGEDY